MKGPQKDGIKTLLLPTNDNKTKTFDLRDDDDAGWINVYDTNIIFHELLHQNAKLLVKSENVITATGAFSKYVGQYAENEKYIEPSCFIV